MSVGQLQVVFTEIDQAVAQLQYVAKESRRGVILKQAMFTSLAPVRLALRNNIRRKLRRRTGNLARAIATKAVRYPSGVVVGVVGAKRGAESAVVRGQRVVPANYLHLVDLGVKPHLSSSARAWRFLDLRTGRWRTLNKARGGGHVHPGVAPREMRAAASKQVAASTADRFARRFTALLERELRAQKSVGA